MIQENPDMACNTNVIRKAISEARNWCFTLNNYTDDEIKQLKNDIPILCAKFVVGIETGENNTPHRQGYIKLHKKKRPFALGWSPRIHWELAKKDGLRIISIALRVITYYFIAIIILMASL